MCAHAGLVSNFISAHGAIPIDPTLLEAGKHEKQDQDPPAATSHTHTHLLTAPTSLSSHSTLTSSSCRKWVSTPASPPAPPPAASPMLLPRLPFGGRGDELAVGVPGAVLPGVPVLPFRSLLLSAAAGRLSPKSLATASSKVGVNCPVLAKVCQSDGRAEREAGRQLRAGTRLSRDWMVAQVLLLSQDSSSGLGRGTLGAAESKVQRRRKAHCSFAIKRHAQEDGGACGRWRMHSAYAMCPFPAGLIAQPRITETHAQHLKGTESRRPAGCMQHADHNHND